MKKFLTIFAILIFAIGASYGQTEDLDKSIQDQSKRLENLQSEISKLNNKINKTVKDEQYTASQIKNLEKQIVQVARLKRKLQQERKLKESEIGLLEETILTTDKKIQVMKERAASRAVRSYKMGKDRDIDLLLTSGDVNQALRRGMYLSAVNKAEAEMLADLQDMIYTNKTRQYDLNRKLGEINKNLREKEQASRQTSSRQRKKEAQLKKYEQNRKTWEKQVKVKRAAAKEVDNIIHSLEKEKQARLREIARQRGMTLDQAKGEFAKYKGRLSWPVKGTLVGRFGPQRNERLGTVTNNPGIDIAAPKGRPVQAVLDGIVVTITWIPGYGNTMIVDHGDSYYTVYAHVDNIKINMSGSVQERYVLRDQVIAQVSDTGSLDGARLHFEVWKGKDKVDPLKWLKR